jgi:hypothetical protein
MSQVNVANSSAFLAAEVLVEMIGQEVAQKSNMPETCWVKYLTGTKSATAHYRWENPFATSTLASAVDGYAGAMGLPVGSWAPSEATVSVGLGGQTIPVTEAIIALDPEVLASVTRQSSTVLVRDIDSSVCALLPTLALASVTGSGTSTTLTVNDILLAQSELLTAHADQVAPLVGRLHPHQFYNLYKDIKASNYGIAKVYVDASGKEVIEIGSITLKSNTFVPLTNTNANYTGGVYVDQAIGLAIGVQPTVKVSYVPGSAEYAVDAYLSFGTSLLRSGLGVPIVSSATA